MSTIQRMELTSQVLHDAEFREAKRGGYNTQDVDEFLERIAAAVERQEALSAKPGNACRPPRPGPPSRAASGRHRATHGGHSRGRRDAQAHARAGPAHRRCGHPRGRGAGRPHGGRAEDHVARMLSEAQETTANAYADAEAEARQSQEEARAKVLNELNELEAMRHQLRHDVELLERHLEQQRERVRVTIHDLQRLLDDPGALREAAVPTFDEVQIPSTAPSRNPTSTRRPAVRRWRPSRRRRPANSSLSRCRPWPPTRTSGSRPGAALVRHGAELDESEYAPMPPAPRRRAPTPRRARGGHATGEATRTTTPTSPSFARRWMTIVPWAPVTSITTRRAATRTSLRLADRRFGRRRYASAFVHRS